MKKTIGLSLLTLLAAGMMSGAAFADPPFLNGHILQNNHYGWNNHHRDYGRDNDRFRDARKEAKEHWRFERQRLSERRHFEHERLENRLQHLRTAEARYDRNHSWWGR